MTDTLTCVTNIMDDTPSCTVRDEHEDRCDGWEYRYARGPHEWTEIATGRPCRGCVPRPAEHGMLCTACWRSLEGALRAAPPLVDLLSSYDRLVQQTGGGGSTDPTVPLAPTKLALDEIESYERSRRGRPAEVWVANEAGAIDAVRFTRAVRSGVSAFPDTEKTTVVPRTRCPECQMLVLQWTPPTLEGDPVRIVCRNPACGFELDQGSLDTVRRTHLVDHPAGTTAREWLKQAAASGTRVVSVCGHEWTPTTTKGPSYPPCPDCTTIVNRHQEAPRMRKQTVTVYTKPDCVQCDWTKKWLTNHDVPFDVEDILDEGNLAAVRELGYSAAPVVMVSQGILRDEAHWSGFQPGKLAQFVKVGEVA